MTKSEWLKLFGQVGEDTREFVVGYVADAIHGIPSGPPGPSGERGPSGEKGEKGDTGPPGQDADPAVLLAIKTEWAEMRGEWMAFKQWQSGNRTAAIDEPALVERVKAAVLSTLPAPKDGRDGIDGKDGAPGPAGADGRDGASIDPSIVDVMVAAQVERAIKAIPVPKDGQPGPPGEKGERGETGTAGKDGKDGPQGPPGEPGAAGKDGEKGEPGMAGKDGAAGAVGPAGPQGEKGADGAHGQQGEKGLGGAPGRDGVGMTGALIDRKGHLILTLSDGGTKDVGMVVGKDIDPTYVDRRLDELTSEKIAQIPLPKDGVDGKDGLGFDDMETEHDEHGRLYLKFVRGEQSKSIPVPGLVDRGVYKPGEHYQKGDGVTWGGAFWIAQWDTTAKPGEPTPESRAWRLAVKAGRDGKPGRDGTNGGGE